MNKKEAIAYAQIIIAGKPSIFTNSNIVFLPTPNILAASSTEILILLLSFPKYGKDKKSYKDKTTKGTSQKRSSKCKKQKKWKGGTCYTTIKYTRSKES